MFCVLIASTALPDIARADTVSFAPVGVGQEWTVPAGVTSATFDLYGAQGGGTSGGKGAHVRATIDVTPGEEFFVFVGVTGGLGATGFNGGGKGGTGSGTNPSSEYRAFGGGGATDVRRGGTALDNRLMVAAGGGGASSGGSGGNSGARGTSQGGDTGGGGAATGTAGGDAGGVSGGNRGNPGLFGVGGAGQETGPNYGGGGGGGGVWGGGGGAGDSAGYDGGGGGGSSQVAPSSMTVRDPLLDNGVRSGDGAGSVTFTPGTASAPPPPPGPGGGTTDTTKPTLGSLGFSTTVFKAASSGSAFSAQKRTRRAPTGTKVSFNLSEASSVKFTVQRKTSGRRVSGKCRSRTRKNRKKPKCTLWKNVTGSFTVPGNAGENTFTFRGRISGKKLRPARYRLTGTATDPAKNNSAPKRKGFKIVK